MPPGVLDALDYLDAAGRIRWPAHGGTPRFIRYLDDMEGMRAQDVITDIPPLSAKHRERTGYPTQKPLALLERIVRASSDEGDVVLDPFCGCATTCIAAEKLGRQWIGIDLSGKAVDLVKLRLVREVAVYEKGGLFGDVVHRTDIPRRSDLGRVPHYRTHLHTLYGRQEGDCAGCRIHFPIRNLTVDHVVPKAKGGGDELLNLQLLCGACNSTKGAGSQAELLARLRRQGIGPV